MGKHIKWGELVLISVIVATLTIILTACNSSLFIPKTVTVDGITYRNGFYGDLWPVNLTFDDGSIKDGNYEFRHVDYDKFDWIHSYVGGTTAGVLYCEESQWQQASVYYADNDNFVYYCLIGGKYVEHGAVIETINNIESDKFDALMTFADENDYNPFGSNKDVETDRLPIPDKDESPELIFYKESKDGYFTSFKGHTFHVLDGQLLFLFYYDYGHGEYEEMVAVNVPDELGEYFMKLLEQLEE